MIAISVELSSDIAGRQPIGVDVVGQVDQRRLRIHPERGRDEFRVHRVDHSPTCASSVQRVDPALRNRSQVRSAARRRPSTGERSRPKRPTGDPLAASTAPAANRLGLLETSPGSPDWMGHRPGSPLHSESAQVGLVVPPPARRSAGYRCVMGIGDITEGVVAGEGERAGQDGGAPLRYDLSSHDVPGPRRDAHGRCRPGPCHRSRAPPTEPHGDVHRRPAGYRPRPAQK